MATSRRSYTDEEKAMAFVALRVNEGNVLRTVRETGIPQQTLRQWRKKWETEGVPPAVQQLIESEADDYLVRYEQLRDRAVARLDETLNDAKPRELITIIGVMDDKITRARGLATHRSEVVHTGLPSAAEVRDELVSFVRSALSAAQQREEDIIEVEYTEQAPKALGIGG